MKHYTGGMRRRIDIAASLVVTPELLFLDQPTTGLDPRSRNQVWDIVRALSAGGTTILLCTQYLEEANQLADGIAVINSGRVIAEGTPGQLKASVGTGVLRIRLQDPAQRAAAAEVLTGELLEGELEGISLDGDGTTLLAQCTDPPADTAAVRRAISSTARPARPGPLSTAVSFGWRGMLKIRHVPEQLLDVTVTPVMFVLMFTYLFGGAVAGSTASYLSYILPGILVMSVLFTRCTRVSR